MSLNLELLHLLPPAEQERIWNGPALAPPDNVTLPNFDNPPNKNHLVFSVTTIALSLSSALVIARAYSRIFAMRKVQAEDALLFIGYGLFVGFCYCCYRIINGSGLFVHQWNIRLRDLSEYSYVINMASTFYAGSMGCLKVAILLEWTRLFHARGSRDQLWYACWALLVTNALFYSAGLIAGNLSCIPHEKIWNLTLPGKCINRKALDTATASINVLSTLFILALPQKVIWTLHMSVAKKIGVSSLFAIGIFAVVSSILRLVATVRYLRSDDQTYNVSEVAVWCIAEQTCAILVICIPAIPKALRENKYFRRVREWQSGGRTSQSHQPSQSSQGTGWSKWKQQSSPYQKVTENGVALDNLSSVTNQAVNSREQLHRPLDGKPQPVKTLGGITRTTSIVASEADRYGESADSHYSKVPWERR